MADAEASKASAHKSTDLVLRLRALADELGFTLCGITPAVTPSGYSRLVEWIENGYAGQMEYLRDRQQAYAHPDGVLPGARSVIALAYPYHAGPPSSATGAARVARYCWDGPDYHDVLHPKLKQICRMISEFDPETRARGVVDTAPILERDFAQRAGLGWRGKNTLLLNRHHGSYFFLACVLVNTDLPSDASHETAHCGTCTACLDACPTDAFPQAGVLDATKCISYLTIEHRGPIDRELRAGIGNWVFGCDVCQEVCPWNTKPARREHSSSPRPLESLNVQELFAIDEDEFRRRFRKTPLWRTRRSGMLRNAAIVLGNQRCDESSLAALKLGIDDDDPVVRGACAWAFGQQANEQSRDVLLKRLEFESDDSVTVEIQLALQEHANTKGSNQVS